MRLADAWYPDWKATVDGKDTPILRADYLLRAVAVPAGKHTIVMKFVSPSVRTGLLLSIGSLVVVLGLIGAGFLMRRRTAPRTMAAEPAA